MAAPRIVAVLDIGKSNAKVVLIDRGEGRTLGTRTIANTVRRERPYPHCDIDGLWRFALDGLKALNREKPIEGISITTHGATAAVVDDAGPVLPVLDYEHDGPEQTATEYDATRPPFAETLSPRLPNGLNLGAQLFWQARKFPDAFRRARAILMYPQYWAWRLTGVMAGEVTSLGCHTDLWAPAAKAYSRLPASQGWDRLFPALQDAVFTLGPLSKAIAAETGIAEGTPVACGIHDSNASLLPHIAAHAAPFTVVSSGTWAIVMTVGGVTDRLDAGRDSLAYVDAYGRPVPAARFMAGREFEALAGADPELPTESDIEAVLERSVMALPSFAGGVGPFPASRGRWLGEPANPGERTAAAALYLALVTEVSLALAGCGRLIAVEGPLARSTLYCRALAALTKVGVFASVDATGTAAGAAMLFGGPAAATGAGAAVEPLRHPMFAAYAARWRELAGG
jgi:sugar (pentulose or hexulose) kinase